MTTTLMHIALLVRDYDEAIAYYTNVLNFQLIADESRESEQAGKRWVLVSPRGGGCSILLAKARNERQLAAVGNQSGGRVFLFLHSDDFDADYALFQTRGVRFVEEPRTEAYGRVVVFEDLYGHRWDLLQLNSPPITTTRL